MRKKKNPNKLQDIITKLPRKESITNTFHSNNVSVPMQLIQALQQQGNTHRPHQRKTPAVLKKRDSRTHQQQHGRRNGKEERNEDRSGHGRKGNEDRNEDRSGNVFVMKEFTMMKRKESSYRRLRNQRFQGKQGIVGVDGFMKGVLSGEQSILRKHFQSMDQNSQGDEMKQQSLQNNGHVDDEVDVDSMYIHQRKLNDIKFDLMVPPMPPETIRRSSDSYYRLKPTAQNENPALVQHRAYNVLNQVLNQISQTSRPRPVPRQRKTKVDPSRRLNKTSRPVTSDSVRSLILINEKDVLSSDIPNEITSKRPSAKNPVLLTRKSQWLSKTTGYEKTGAYLQTPTIQSNPDSKNDLIKQTDIQLNETATKTSPKQVPSKEMSPKRSKQAERAKTTREATRIIKQISKTLRKHALHPYNQVTQKSVDQIIIPNKKSALLTNIPHTIAIQSSDQIHVQARKTKTAPSEISMRRNCKPLKEVPPQIEEKPKLRIIIPKKTNPPKLHESVPCNHSNQAHDSQQENQKRRKFRKLGKNTQSIRMKSCDFLDFSTDRIQRHMQAPYAKGEEKVLPPEVPQSPPTPEYLKESNGNSNQNLQDLTKLENLMKLPSKKTCYSQSEWNSIGVKKQTNYSKQKNKNSRLYAIDVNGLKLYRWREE